MRKAIQFFAFLDVLTGLVLLFQLGLTLSSPFPQLLSEQIQKTLMFPVFALIILGIIGTFRRKKYGYIAYYIQFPFRLYLTIFSFWFITAIPEFMGVFNDNLSNTLIKICFVVEVLRLYITIRTQLNDNC